MKPAISKQRIFLTLLLYLLFINMKCIAQIQREYEWRFGSYAGISFATGAPALVNNVAMYTSEGNATMSDPSGNLLFYTNGLYVYDSTNNIMPNGTGLGGSGISAQSALIVPAPGNPNQYYIFTISNWTDPSTILCYSIVDMTLNSGKGNITTAKNVVVNSNAREQVTATNHANGQDIWIMTHEGNNQNFCAYLLTATGLDTTPVISVSGMNYAGNNRFGSLRFSHNCTKIVSALGGTPSAGNETVQLLDFDNATGIVSNPITLGINFPILNAYSSEFSPDDSKLYVVSFNSGFIYQFDLNASNIDSSQTDIATGGGGGTKSWLQLAPDNKIYVCMAYTNFLSTIDFPDNGGLACNYSNNSVTMSNYCSLCLPNFMNLGCQANPSTPVINFASSDTILCEKSCIDFTDLSTNNPTQWQWSFPNAQPDTSTLQNPLNICFNTYGTFTVTLTATNASGSGSLTKVSFITVLQNPPNPVITYGNDTLFCSPASGYQWYFNATLVTGATLSYYTPALPGNYYVVITDSNGCQSASGQFTTGVNEIYHQSAVYNTSPDPSDGNFTLSFTDGSKPYEIKVTDASGRNVFRGFHKNGLTEFLRLRLDNGIYFLTVSSEHQVNSACKIVINR